MTEENKNKGAEEIKASTASKIESAEKKVFSTLSDEDKQKIEKQVERELEEEAIKKAKDEYKKSLIAEKTKKALFKDGKSGEGVGLVPVLIDLPPFSDAIRLDGTAYYHGRTYNVTPEVAATMYEIMHRGKEHEDEVKGRKDSNRLRSKRADFARM
jgi:hypothetical protein